MVKKTAFFALMLAVAMAGSATSSLAAGRSASHPTGKRSIVSNDLPQFLGSTKVLNFVGARIADIVRVVGSGGVFGFPSLGNLYETYGINDGPDGCDPLGVKGSQPRNENPPASSSTRVP